MKWISVAFGNAKYKMAVNMASKMAALIAGRILSPMTWFGLVRISHSCQILSVDGACLSLAAFVVPTPVKTILELFKPAFRVLLKTGDAESEQ